MLHPFGLLLCPLLQSGENSVGRGLCRQSKEDACTSKSAANQLRRCQCSFRLSNSHLGLQNENSRLHTLLGRPNHFLLNRIPCKSKPTAELLRIHGIGIWAPLLRQRQSIPPVLNPCWIGERFPHIFQFQKWKIRGIAGNPVCHNQQTGGQHLGWNIQLRKIVNLGISTFVQCKLDPILPHCLPLHPIGAFLPL